MPLENLPIGSLGPARVLWGANDLGQIKKIEFFHTDVTMQQTVARSGAAVVREIGANSKARIELNLALTTLANLGIIIPGATITANQLKVGNTTGYDYRANANTLTIKPEILGLAGSDATAWLAMALTHPKIDLAWPYAGEGTDERNIKVMFDAYPVEAFDIGTDGALYNSGSPDWEANDLWAVGLGETT